MSYDYSSFVALATRLISKYGRDVTRRVQSNTGSSFNPTLVNTDTTIKAVMTDFKANEIDGTLIQQSDKMFLSYSEVTKDDKIVDGGIEYSVINVNTVHTGDTKIIYKIQARL